MAVKRYDGSAWQTVAGLGAQGPAGANGANGADGSAPLTTKGDLLTRSSTTATRLGVGTNGQVLVADSAEVTGLKWAPGGKVLQVVQTTKTDTFSTTSASYTDITGFSVSITPSSTSSKILIIMMVSGSTSGTNGPLTLLRGSTQIFLADSAGSRTRSTANLANAASINEIESNIVLYLDSPSTTSSTTYKLQTAAIDGGGTVYINRGSNDFDASNRMRSASSIIAMEVGA